MITIDPSTIVLTRPTPWNRLAEMVGDLRAAGATVTVTVGDETVKSLLSEAAQMDREAGRSRAVALVLDDDRVHGGGAR